MPGFSMWVLGTELSCFLNPFQISFDSFPPFSPLFSLPPPLSFYSPLPSLCPFFLPSPSLSSYFSHTIYWNVLWRQDYIMIKAVMIAFNLYKAHVKQ